MLILVITGKIGSGKDTASDYLRQNYSFSTVSYSEIAHDKTREQGLETTRTNLQKVSTECRARYGTDYFAKLVISKARSLGSERVILKEARTAQDVQPAMKAFGRQLHVIEITTLQSIRLERLIKRGCAKDAKTKEELMAQETREKELGYFGAAQLAEERISNSGTPEELHKKLDSLMTRLLG